MNDRPDQDMLAHYAAGIEANRLRGRGGVEFERTRSIIERYLPDAQCCIYDVGGGPGTYAFWLASLGHEVHLLDIVPLHIEQARTRSAADAIALASAEVGDARSLPRADASVDLVLLLGPLYHLQQRTDRLACLAEAQRVLRPGGFVIAAAISRFASALDGIARGFLDDPEFAAIVDEDLRTGRHSNTNRRTEFFTTAYFHTPAELLDEVTAAGFEGGRLLAIEGPSWLAGISLADCSDRAVERFYDLLETMEAEPSLIGASSHFVCTAIRE